MDANPQSSSEGLSLPTTLRCLVFEIRIRYYLRQTRHGNFVKKLNETRRPSRFFTMYIDEYAAFHEETSIPCVFRTIHDRKESDRRCAYDVRQCSDYLSFAAFMASASILPPTGRRPRSLSSFLLFASAEPSRIIAGASTRVSVIPPKPGTDTPSCGRFLSESSVPGKGGDTGRGAGDACPPGPEAVLIPIREARLPGVKEPDGRSALAE